MVTEVVCVLQYVSEAVAAIAESSIKTKDIGAAVQVCPLALPMLGINTPLEGLTISCLTPCWHASGRSAPCCTSATPTLARSSQRSSSTPSAQAQEVATLR